MTYKQTRKLDPVDAAYIAGLIDGEGTVTLSRRNQYKHRSLDVVISNTEIALLRHVQETAGVGKITKKRTVKAHHTPSYAYHVSNRQALALLRQINPFMRSHKSDRAALALKDYVRLTPRNGLYSTVVLEQREAFIQRFFAIKPCQPLLESDLGLVDHPIST